jgi:hypothetical protein
MKRRFIFHDGFDCISEKTSERFIYKENYYDGYKNDLGSHDEGAKQT